ncbi:MAG: hypothetical protein K2N34_02340 [Lachnospiraceae bacterium]|nr:hypothetical protein [Lachnospiraceae bacterium]
MTYQNAQTKNIGNDEGDVLNFFQTKIRNLIQKNGGDHSFSFIMEEWTNKDAPMPVGTKTRIKLTHSGHTISQIEKSFNTVLLEFDINLDTKIDMSADEHNLHKIFVGFKNAVEFFEDCRFWVDGRLLDSYRQDELQRESFAFNSIKPRDCKAPAKYSHSLWENVSKYSPSVCGCYVDLKDLTDGKKHRISIELTIPFTDQLALQAWQLYPNRICGEIEEEVKTSLSALVWCQVSPNVVKETLQFLDDEDIDEDIPAVIPISRKFTQIGNPTNIVVEYKAAEDELDENAIPVKTNDATNSLKVGKAILYASNGTIQLGRSNLAGFGLKEGTFNGLVRELQEPLLVPSQELTREIFEGSAKPNGLEVSKSIPLRNATNITMMFPKRSSDITCFDNIMYQNVQLTVNKRTYPDTEFSSTCGARFYQHMLIANELDGALEPAQEFEDSFTQPLNDLTTGARYKNCRSDGTSFGINFQLERSNAGYVFDGLDTGSTSITVTFRGQPMFSGENDTYYNFEEGLHPVAPEAWICSDTYFVWSVKGVQYHPNGIPEGYE